MSTPLCLCREYCVRCSPRVLDRILIKAKKGERPASSHDNHDAQRKLYPHGRTIQLLLILSTYFRAHVLYRFSASIFNDRMYPNDVFLKEPHVGNQFTRTSY